MANLQVLFGMFILDVKMDDRAIRPKQRRKLDNPWHIVLTDDELTSKLQSGKIIKTERSDKKVQKTFIKILQQNTAKDLEYYLY